MASSALLPCFVALLLFLVCNERLFKRDVLAVIIADTFAKKNCFVVSFIAPIV